MQRVDHLAAPPIERAAAIHGRNPRHVTRSSTAGRRIAYARVSTSDQTTLMQVQDFEAYGVDEIVEEVGSGGNNERPQLLRLLKRLRAGDTLVVWRLDRLGRSLPHLVETVRALEAKAVGFVSLRDVIDTSSAGGRLYFHIFAALAEFERDLIRERVSAGLAAARAEGRIGGRPRVVTPEVAARCAEALKRMPVTQAAREAGVSRAALYQAIRDGVVWRE